MAILLTLPMSLQMSSRVSSANSQHSPLGEVQQPTEVLEVSSSPYSTPTPKAIIPAYTISARTRSKSKNINPIPSNIPPRKQLFSHKIRDTKLAILSKTPSDDEDEASNYDNKSTEGDHEPDQEAVKTEIPQGVELDCDHLDSIMNPVKLTNLLQTCKPGCKLMIPAPGERCHHFDSFEPDQPIPQAVLFAQFFKLGLSLPMHPFIQELLEFYDIAPLQLTPNSYRMAMCMYILYKIELEKDLTAHELGYFYQLKQSGKNTGYFYLAAWNVHEGKCIRGNKQGMTGWFKQFLYCYDCPAYRVDFNASPSKHLLSK